MGNLAPEAIAGIVLGSVFGVCILIACLVGYLPDRKVNDDHVISFRRHSSASTSTHTSDRDETTDFI
jgi:hypothetical protein